MKSLPSRLAVSLLVGLLSFPAFAAEPVATVNGVVIPASRLDALVAAQRAQGVPDSPQLREQLKERLIRLEVISQEATKKGFDKKAAVLEQMDLIKRDVLASAYIQDFAQSNRIQEADLRKEYDSMKSAAGDKEYKPRHVLVETEDQAKAIIAKLQGGSKFEDLAKESRDPGSKERGGELGWSNPSMFVKPFSDAMVKLEKGKYTTTPVKSDFGYHVIMLDDVRPLAAPPFEELKPRLEQKLISQKLDKHLLDLRNKAKVQ